MATAVVLLHTLRARRRPHVVSSLFLWERVRRELASDHRRRLLLKTLLLVLQLLILTLLAVALAGPGLPPGRAPLHVGIVVDTSASMGVGGETPPATAARERLQAFLSQGEADRYILWTTTGELLRYDGDSKDELIARLADLPPPGGVSDWERVYQQVTAGVDGDIPTHLIIATDGAVDVERVAPLRFAGPLVSLYLIDSGRPADNLAITGFSARPSGRGDGHHQVLIQVANFGSAPAETFLRVIAHEPSQESTEARDEGESLGRLVHAARLQLPEGTSQRVLFEHWFLPGEILTAEIETADPLPADDVAFLVANPSDATRVLVVGEENRFLIQGLQSFPQVEMARSFDPLAAVDPGASYDLTVFYDVPVPDGFLGTALVFESTTERSGEPAEITWWDRRHPVSRFVDWQMVSAGIVRPLIPDGAESVLLQSSAGPLITLLEEEGRRILRVGLSLEQSDFPFRVAFPVFLQNVLEWAKPEGQTVVPPASALGSLPPAVAAAWDESGVLALTLPTGDEIEIMDKPTQADVSELLVLPGVYAWRAGRQQGRFALSLLDAEESDLTPRLADPMAERGVDLLDHYGDFLKDLPQYQAIDAESGAHAFHPVEGVWEWVSVGVLLLLLVEGSLYTSRRAKRFEDPGPLSLGSHGRRDAGAIGSGVRNLRPGRPSRRGRLTLIHRPGGGRR